jgi:hypothetical protein
MAKLLLSNTAMVEDFLEDTSLIGIVSAQPGYRMCWMINNHFEIDFTCDPDQSITLRKKDRKKTESEYVFPVYQFDLPNSYYKYLLYKLKNGSESLLPESRQIDYLWLVQTGNSEDDANHIINELRSIPDIQLVLLLDKNELKNLDNLLV